MTNKKEFIPFTESYSEIHNEWNLNKRAVRKILKRYTRQLEEELNSLKTHPLNLPKCFKDKRSDEKYIYDILSGWVMEDIICDIWLKKSLHEYDPNITIEHSGADKERNVEKYARSRVSSDPDFIFRAYNQRVEIELQMSRKRRDSYDMKAHKVKKVAQVNGKFLWLVVEEGTFFICHPKKLMKISPIKNHLWGGKLVHRVEQRKLRTFPISGGFSPEMVKLLLS